MSKKIFVATLILLSLQRDSFSETRKEEDAFKNVHLFTKLSRGEISTVMNFMRASLGVHCDYCHVVGKKGWEFGNDAKPPKLKAREMISMVIDLNKANFKGEPVVTCFTCHQGRIRPNGTPALPQVTPPFPTPIPQEPAMEVESNKILAQYQEAIGGERRSEVLKARSLIYKGTTNETWKRKVVPFEARYKAPDKWLLRKELEDRVVTYVLTGEGGRVQEGSEMRDISDREMPIVRDMIESLQLIPAIPASKPVAVTKRTIQDREALALEYEIDERVSEFFYFDAQTHLLLGRKRYTLSPIGSIPREIKYENYKNLGGVNIAYTMTSDYVDPWIGGTYSFSEILVDVPLEDKDFELPR